MTIYTISNDSRLFEIVENSNVGDIIQVITNNQLGVRIYKVVVKEGKKGITTISNIDMLVEDAEKNLNDHVKK